MGRRKLENYKGKDDLLAAVEGADAMIIRSDIVDAAVLEKANQLKIVVRAGAGDSLKIERSEPCNQTGQRLRYHEMKLLFCQ